jgi:membrane associated rhomboid family serine protease
VWRIHHYEASFARTGSLSLVEHLDTWWRLFGADNELELARVGALFRPAVLAGEWWRLFTAMFLHVGLLHIGANMYGMYLLGRATEEVLSWPRLVLIYAMSGLGGGLASLWADPGLAVGASGAIMGLLAALTVIVFVRRHQFHPVARRVLLGNLAFLAVLQAFIGWQVPMIDSAAHAGGFVAGLFATAGLVPARNLGRAAQRALAALAIAVIAVFAVAAIACARRSLSDTLLSLSTAPMVSDGVRIELPRDWRRDASGLIVDRHLGIELRVRREGARVIVTSPQADDPQVRPLLERISKTATLAP